MSSQNSRSSSSYSSSINEIEKPVPLMEDAPDHLKKLRDIAYRLKPPQKIKLDAERRIEHAKRKKENAERRIENAMRKTAYFIAKEIIDETNSIKKNKFYLIKNNIFNHNLC